jgi:TetR/AcrR family transcriptional regulator, cholesterol catabolism regulator
VATAVRASPSSALSHAQRERWDRIVQSALELLDGGEYDHIQMRDVATRAGVALGTLYHYFASKEHLYAAVMLRWFDSFQRRLVRDELPAGPDERLKELLRRTTAAFARKPQFLRVMFILEASADPHARELFDQFSGLHSAEHRAALTDFSERDADLIRMTTSSVLGNMLRSFALGQVGIERVDEIVLGTVDLIFSDPPVPIDA